MTLTAALRRSGAIGLRAWLFVVLAICDALILFHSITLAGQALNLWDWSLLPGTMVLLVGTPFVLVPLAVTGVLVDSWMADGKRIAAARAGAAIAVFVLTAALGAVFLATFLFAEVNPLVGLALLAYLVRHDRPWREEIEALTRRRRSRWLGRSVLLAPVLGVAALAGALVANLAERERYLIPDGYIGWVTVLFRIPDGEPESYDDGVREYRIPADGVLRTRFQPNLGIQRQEYFYATVGTGAVVKAITGRTTSTIHDTPENRSNSEVEIHGGAFGLYGGGTTGSPPQGPIDISTPCAIAYQQFYVGRRADALDRQMFDLGAYLDAHPVHCNR